MRSYMRLCFVVSFLLGLYTVLPVEAESPDWGLLPVIENAPLSPVSPPSGCECMDSQCLKYDCSCTCNLTAHQCDMNCCCDSECFPEEIDEFRMRGSCLPEGPVNHTIRSCIDTTNSYALSRINPGPRMKVERSPAIDSVLCIAIDNSPLRGRYLIDVGSLPVDTLSLPKVRREYSFDADSRPEFRSTHSRYVPGDTIPIGAFSGGTFHSVSGGFWMIPEADSSKHCSDFGFSQSVLFGMNKVPSTCYSETVFTQASCESRSLMRLVSGIYLAKRPFFSPSGGVSDFVQVTLSSVSVWDTVAQTITLLPPGSYPSSTLWSSATCTCSSVILSILYTVEYSGGVITSVGADVVLTDVEQSLVTCGLEKLTLPFSIATRFVSSLLPVDSTSFEKGNSHRYARSGSPGYVFHSPLRGGVLIAESESDTSGLTPLAPTDKLAISVSPTSDFERVAFARGTDDEVFGLDGLRLIGPNAKGECVSSGVPFSAANPRLVPITFGDDLSVSCRVSLSRADLMTLCSSTSPFASTLGLAKVPVSTSSGIVYSVPTHVAIFGNSDPWKSWEWIRISEPVSLPSSPIFDPLLDSCIGLVSGVKYEVLWTRVAERSNSQPKVLAIRKEYMTDNWTVRMHDVSNGVRSPKQSMHFKSIVSFVEYAAAEEDYVAPPRPLIPSVPSDIWYPFNTVGLRDNQIISGE